MTQKRAKLLWNINSPLWQWKVTRNFGDMFVLTNAKNDVDKKNPRTLCEYKEALSRIEITNKMMLKQTEWVGI